MQRWRRCGLALLASSMANALPGGVAAQNEGGPARAVGGPAPVANAVGALAIPASEAPRVDGYDLEDFWQRAPVLDRFIEYHPAQDADPRFRTEVRFAYDADNLYILARMYDPAPDSIMTNIGRRDVDYPADWIAFTLDGYHDRRTAMEFRVSAGGGRYDAQRLRDAQGLEVSWDGVWDAETRVDERGWVAELRIPFSQMRFPDVTEPVFGLVVRRDVGREDRQIAWPRIDGARILSEYVSQGGDLVGLSGIGAGGRLEVSPYLVSQNVTRAGDAGLAHPTGHSMGADLRWGMTPNLTLSATINPDFGQVEADPAELNLSSYELFYDERRPFFQEGTGIFSFLAWCDDVGTDSCKEPFYSRRVGRAPQLRSLYGDAASPIATPVAGAAKLSGRMGRGTSVGVIAALTQRQVGTQDRTIEPGSRYLVARLKQELPGQRGEVGGIFTSVGRDVDSWTDPYLRSRADMGGLDLRLRTGWHGVELDAAVTASRVAGSPSAITRLQRDPVHRYQRPGDGLDVDTLATSLSGQSVRVGLLRGTGNFRFEALYQAQTPGYEVNDLGYQQRADRQVARAWIAYQARSSTAWYRVRTVGLFTQQTWTSEGEPIGTAEATPWPSRVSPYANITLRNSSQLNMGAHIVMPGGPADDRITRGGPALRQSTAYGAWVYYRTPMRNRVYGEGTLWRYVWDAGNSLARGGRLYVTARPDDRLLVTAGFMVNDYVNHQLWHSTRKGPSGETLYTFVAADVVIFDPRMRVDWTVTPDVTLQFYAQAYATTGDYDAWRAVGDPEAEGYDDRWASFAGGDPGGFDVQQLRTNTVLRWEFRPGSILYLVWQQRRDGNVVGPAAFDLTEEMRSMFGLRPDNTFLVKMSYWLNP